MIFEYMEYNTPLINTKNQADLKFFGDNQFNQETIDKITSRTPHAYTEQLATAIEKEMSSYGLSDAQKENIEKLKKGHRVIIGGQQAGLLMSPSYILHKIITLFILRNDVKNKFNYDAVPVFWVAGEDHDYDEVNHTHVYDKYHNRIKKIAYKPNLTVPMSIGFYDFDKKAMKRVVDEMFNYLYDSSELLSIKEILLDKIEHYHSWTDFFTSLVHELFKDEGLLIVNAHNKEIREIEKDAFKELFNRHLEVDAAFRSGQEDFIKHFKENKTIETDTNVHLFINSTESRNLLKFEDGVYYADGHSYTKDEILEKIESNSIEVSNNVVTRPLMQEFLFNTLIFVGGGAEVKYWGELHKVFETLDIEMPLVLKRMEFTYISKELQNKMAKYDLSFSKDLIYDLEKVKAEIVSNTENKRLLKTLDKQEYKIMNQYDELKYCCQDEWERQLIESNYKVQLKQVNYIKRRYRLEAMRKVRDELSNLKEIEQLLLPFGVLQERIYHPLTFFTKIWDYKALVYAENLVVIKE